MCIRDRTTADIADSSNKRYVTDAQLTVLGNTSGINTGDQVVLTTADSQVSFSVTPTFPVIVHTSIQNFTMTLTNNVTSSTLDTTSATDGQEIVFNICQNSTGNFTFAWPSNVTGHGTVAPNLSTCSRQVFLWDGTNAVAKGPMTCPSCPPGFTVPGLVSGSNQISAPGAQGTSTTTLPVGASTTVLPDAGAANEFVTGITSGGVITRAQPTEANLSTSDVTTNNATTAKHGLLKKLSNNANEYMDGTGNWSTPAGGGGGTITTRFWYPFGYPGYNAGNTQAMAPSNVNGGVRFAFVVPATMALAKVYLHIQTAGAAGTFGSVAVYNDAMTTKHCETTPHAIDATGVTAFSWSTTCTLNAGTYYGATTADTTSAQIYSLFNGSFTPLESIVTTIAYDTTGCLSTGSGSSIAFVANASGCTFNASAGVTPPVIALGQ